MAIEYEIIFQKRKTVSIQINNGEVIVKAPMKYPKREIQAFVDKKEGWIKKHLKISNNKPHFSYKDGEDFHFLGKKYTLQVIEKAIQEKVEFYDNRLIVFSHRKKGNISRNRKILSNWIHSQAEEILTARYDKYFELFNYKNKPEIFLKYFKGRWGAYHKKFMNDYITLNINLIMYPIECIDYVVVHELAHKKEQNHSKKFYAIVEEKYPDWKKYKKMLDGRVD